MKCLVIDDMQLSRYIAIALLDAHGIECDCARNAEEALIAVKTASYDFMLVDMYLPDGTGAELIPKLREFAADSVYVGYTAEGKNTKMRDVGVTLWLYKPPTHVYVSEMLEQVRLCKQR